MTETDALDDATAHRLLASDRRRAVLDALDGAGPLDRDELARRVYDHADVQARDLRAVTISLYHNHLPRLQSHGVIEETRDGYALTDETILNRANPGVARTSWILAAN